MYTKKWNRPIDPDKEIVVTCGGTEAMMAAMMTVCNPETRLRFSARSRKLWGRRDPLRGRPDLYSACAAGFPLRQSGPGAAFRDGAKALILCNPSNPMRKSIYYGRDGGDCRACEAV